MGMMDNPAASIAERVITEYQIREAARGKGVIEIDNRGLKPKTSGDEVGKISGPIADGLMVMLKQADVSGKIGVQIGEEENG